MEKMSVLTLIFLTTMSGVYADSHFLYYCYTGVTDPGSGLPEFSSVGYMDGQQVELYTSDIVQSIPVAHWIKEKEVLAHWEGLTRIRRENEAFYRHELKIAVKTLNLTEGFHYVQAMLGCELRDDGSTIGFNQYANDGSDFMYLDLQTTTFIPTMANAQIITQKWNSPESGIRERVKDNDKICINRLIRYLEYGRQHLERRVQPGVKVTGRVSDEFTKLHCHVYGFHPRAVHVKWMKNEDDVPSYDTTHTLPNPDGTYQIRVSVEVIPKKGESYSCYVDHSSLKEPRLVKWEPEQNNPLAVSIGAVAAVGILIAVIVGVLIYKKNHNYSAASTSDVFQDSNKPVDA